ncbi:low-density lipoprotein receptor [Folsomia candida]|uniref:Low-density lipoprotein receptor n=1 Tax=Folsomia candida TaxID=158441 RepID=A0A226F3T9_FOLCA|nr:low-density lipoprotein receptor [Folsomia candida]XP_035702632.1 low-density lipoprotein receptor [Folsomia candida]OXA64455.1 Low-density lipoprotein receptor [Folsomia candida]
MSQNINKFFFLSVVVTFILLQFLFVEITSRKVCGPNAFRCRDGKGCVAALDVCDGESHCLKDSSDENVHFCSGNYTGLTKQLIDECAAGMYRCRFGGCINAQHLCNGVIDCYDGSDETYDICRKNRCSKNKFRCDYGACIKGSLSCNGKPNCPDGSDETRTLCEDHVCQINSFKCNYGACIPDSKVCDKKPDCLDKSDEFQTACEGDFNGTDITPDIL